jgi:RNA polymerase sigma factor (sigma-70 family)
MSKKYFIMNNRENTRDGYTEVSEEFFKNYINSFPEDERAYFINLGYAVMETTQTEYQNFYKEYRRKRYVDEESQRAGLVSLNDIDSDELDGTGVVVDTSEPFEEKVFRNIMTDKLPEAISILNPEEKELIIQLYFEGISENALSAVYGVHQSTLSRRKQKILLKLKNFFEK